MLRHAPKKLYHPVLQYRFNQKVLLCLCRTCAVGLNVLSECTHTEVEERELTGTWVMMKSAWLYRNYIKSLKCISFTNTRSCSTIPNLGKEAFLLLI
jgi:hypothetical protein